MKILRGLLKETGLQLAFIVSGVFLLISFWSLQNLDRDLLSEFKEDRISIVLEADQVAEFKKILESNAEVLRYEVHEAKENKLALANLYPELESVLKPLDAEYFPISATVSVKDAQKFLASIKAELSNFGSYLIHEPPQKLKTFLQLSVGLFFGLWLFTLGLILFFQLEYLAHRDEQKWSLMKMLGASRSRVFWPICGLQLARILASCLIAIGVSFWIAREVESIFNWGWNAFTPWVWASFTGISIFIAIGLFMTLFSIRFQKVKLG